MPGQTLTQIRAALQDAGLAPQHRLGQNFLIDLNLMRKIVSAAEVTAADVVLEVGPGTGSLTGLLLETGARVIAVEIDRGLAGLLESRFEDEPNFTLICGDALAGKHAVNPDVLAALARASAAGGGAAPKLVANLPYQIATPLLVDLLLGEPELQLLVCTIQKEVGARLVAAPGTAAYGPVSVTVQTLATVEVIARLGPEAFWPRPQIDSVMLRIVPRARGGLAVADAAAFAGWVQRVFQQRRKTLRRILRDMGHPDPPALVGTLGLSAELRPEQLAPAQWQRLHAAWPGPRR